MAVLLYDGMQSEKGKLSVGMNDFNDFYDMADFYVH